MIDPISLVVGAGLVGLAYALGRATRPKRVDSNAPICGCDHHRALHDPATGTCAGMVDTQEPVQRKDGTIMLDAYNHVIFCDSSEPCPCRQYVGPVPVESLWMPPIASGGGQ